MRLDPVEGSEQGGDRPALVISPDVINGPSPVILVAALTSKKVDRVYAIEVLIEPPEGGLKTPSKVLLMQIRSIDKRRIVGRYGTATAESMQRVEAALKIATGLAII